MRLSFTILLVALIFAISRAIPVDMESESATEKQQDAVSVADDIQETVTEKMLADEEPSTVVPVTSERTARQLYHEDDEIEGRFIKIPKFLTKKLLLFTWKKILPLKLLLFKGRANDELIPILDSNAAEALIDNEKPTIYKNGHHAALASEAIIPVEIDDTEESPFEEVAVEDVVDVPSTRHLSVRKHISPYTVLYAVPQQSTFDYGRSANAVNLRKTKRKFRN